MAAAEYLAKSTPTVANNVAAAGSSASKTEEISHLTPLEARAATNALYGFFYKLVVNEWFNLAVYVLIVGNSV